MRRRAVYNPSVIRQLNFVIGAFCVIAAMSLLRLNLLDSQYAAVVLSTPQETESMYFLAPETSTPSRATFPMAQPRATTTSAKTQNTPIATKPTTPVAAPIQTVATPLPASDFNAVNTVARQAVVNIVCFSPNSESPITASGVIIDPRGVILTNAHVAQYVVLEESQRVALSCEIRTGSPAVPVWYARVIYISSQWIREHAQDIRNEKSTGTGENDYALLRITGGINGAPLPNSFPFVAPNTGQSAQTPNQSVLVASYPAGFLGGVIAIQNLNLVSTITTLRELFTFSNAQTADLMSLGGVIVAQSGSSGGAVVDSFKRLIGIVVTSSTATQTADRDLRAISLFHINQSMIEETGKGLSAYLTGNLDTIDAAFRKDTVPGIQQALVTALLKQ